MNVKETKKAIETIKTFNKREKSLYDCAIGYLKEDMQQILNCEKAKERGENSYNYHEAMKTATKLTFRASYLLQCVDLYVNTNFENLTIEVKTLNDK